MTQWAPNDEGISALNTMAQQIVTAKDELIQSVQKVKSAADGNEAIGPHKQSLDEALEEIQRSVNEAATPVEDISEILKDVAEGYQEVVDTDRIKKTSG